MLPCCVVYVVVVVVCACGVVWHAEKPCITHKRTNTQHRTRKVSLPLEVHQRNPWMLHIFKFENRSRTTCSRFLQSLIQCLRISREQNVPDSSTQSPCLITLFSFSNIQGNFGGKQQPDGSISLSPSPLTLPHPHHNNNNNTPQQQTTPQPPPQPQPQPPQQHTTHRDRDRETKPKFNERFARQTPFHDVRLKKPLTFHNGCMFYLLHTLVIVNRQRHHNIRNGIVWAQTSHTTGTRPHCV